MRIHPNQAAHGAQVTLVGREQHDPDNRANIAQLKLQIFQLTRALEFDGIKSANVGRLVCDVADLLEECKSLTNLQMELGRHVTDLIAIFRENSISTFVRLAAFRLVDGIGLQQFSFDDIFCYAELYVTRMLDRTVDNKDEPRTLELDLYGHRWKVDIGNLTNCRTVNVSLLEPINGDFNVLTALTHGAMAALIRYGRQEG